MFRTLDTALRAPTRNPNQLFSKRRQHHLPRKRSFYSSRRLSNRPTPPGDTDKNPTTNNDNDGAAAEPDMGGASGGRESVPESADSLAQKLQQSRQMTRRYSSALRRSQRRNRAQDLPPVIVPEWFLTQNVQLRKRTLEHPTQRFEHCSLTLHLGVRCSDTYSTCPIPLGNPSQSLDTLASWIRSAWKTEMTATQRSRFVRQLAVLAGAGPGARALEALQGGANALTAQHLAHNVLKDCLADLKRRTAELRSLLQDQRDERIRGKHAELRHVEQELESLWQSYEALGLLNNPSKPQLPSLIRAEIKASMVASLGAMPTDTADSFPCTKTNILLHSPRSEDETVVADSLYAIAAELGIEVVTLTAQDLAEIGGDYLGEGPERTPNSIRALGYQAYRLGSDLEEAVEEIRPDEVQPSDQEEGAIVPFFHVPSAAWSRQTAARLGFSLSPAEPTGSIPRNADDSNTKVWAIMNDTPKGQMQADNQIEDLKLTNLLEHLVDANEHKRAAAESKGMTASDSTSKFQQTSSRTPPLDFFQYSIDASEDILDLAGALPPHAASAFDFRVKIEKCQRSAKILRSSKMVYVKDFKELLGTSYGSRIIQKLEDIVRKRRDTGESIIIVGSTCSKLLTPELSAMGMRHVQSQDPAGVFRSIFITIDQPHASGVEDQRTSSTESVGPKIQEFERSKTRMVNIRHIQDMLRTINFEASKIVSDRTTSREVLSRRTTLLSETLSSRILAYDEIHRLVMTSFGLHLMESGSKQLDWAHITLAAGVLKASDDCKVACIRRMNEGQIAVRTAHLSSSSTMRGKVDRTMAERMNSLKLSQRTRNRRLESIASTATKHEKTLLAGIANPDQLTTTFDQVHVPNTTIDAIRTLTSLSFLRPDAFSYGVLATEKISGALLYGPPGTGKTMLAKATAKESGCTVLEVSGSQIMDKYVGEGEKNVSAIFSLARKLSPCIVFLDEADALFSTRDAGRERSSHRDILNQFLKEWDGLQSLSESSVFVMVATNRPFDLDDAVIRRLPRRLLIDLPTQADRRAILAIHLRGEQLDPAVDLDALAAKTPFYSGSDLKNLAVSAALACVREENERAALAPFFAAASPPSFTTTPPPTTPPPSTGDSTTSREPNHDQNNSSDIPARRILTPAHFAKALAEIGASISEDMSSLKAIRKFDEKYGDGRGRKGKAVYGFGTGTEGASTGEEGRVRR